MDESLTKTASDLMNDPSFSTSTIELMSSLLLPLLSSRAFPASPCRAAIRSLLELSHWAKERRKGTNDVR